VFVSSAKHWNLQILRSSHNPETSIFQKQQQILICYSATAMTTTRRKHGLETELVRHCERRRILSTSRKRKRWQHCCCCNNSTQPSLPLSILLSQEKAEWMKDDEHATSQEVMRVKMIEPKSKLWVHSGLHASLPRKSVCN
jgi:hypothetical protein